MRGRKLIAVLFTALLMACVFPSRVLAEKAPIGYVTAVSDAETFVQYGGAVRAPYIEVQIGNPARFADLQWSRYDEAAGVYLPYTQSLFADGYYLLSGNLVLQGADYDAYTLPDFLSVSVDGYEWTSDRMEDFGSYSAVRVERGYTISGSGLLFSDNPEFDIRNPLVGKPISSYSVAGAAFGGSGSYTFRKVSGPDWVSVYSDGTVSGTPASITQEIVPLVIEVSDGNQTAQITADVWPVTTRPDERTDITAVYAVTYIESAVIAGEDIAGADPQVQVTWTDPVNLPVRAVSYEYEHRGSDGVWRTADSGTFTPGEWRLSVKFRLDGQDAQEYIFAEDMTVKVDGEYWLSRDDFWAGDDYCVKSFASRPFSIADGELWQGFSYRNYGDDLVFSYSGVFADHPESVHYQWQQSSDGHNWADISGATGMSYVTPSSGQGTTYYRVLGYADGCIGAVASNVCTVTGQAERYAITVNNGIAEYSGSKVTSALPGTHIQISAFVSPDGYPFRGWSVEGVEVPYEDLSKVEFYIYMPANPVTATVLYDVPVYWSDDLYIVTASSLNVRSDASSYASRRGGLQYGEFVQADGDAGNWIRFMYDGDEGWAYRDYLALTYSRDTAIAPVYYTLDAGTANVRADISTDSERIGGLKEGDRFLVTGMRTAYDGELWLVTDYCGEDGRHQLGYVMEKLASPDYNSKALELEEPVSLPEDMEAVSYQMNTGHKKTSSWRKGVRRLFNRKHN